MIDYHIHTSLCNHAYGKMEEYVVSALKKGLIEICFLDHLILNDRGKNSSMTIDEIPQYYSEIQRLKRDYEGRIAIKAGLEIDFDTENLSRIEEILDRYSFDVIGGAVHFINGINIASRREAATLKPVNRNELIENYFETIYEMLDYDFFDFICHIDVIKKTGMTITHEVSTLIDNIIKKTAATKKAVELNTAGWHHPAKECYPSLQIIGHCVEANIPIVLSSDAHTPENVGNDFHKALKLLYSLGCTQISSYTNRKRRAVDFT